ncbi:hypothetical protein SKAU_G00405250 [Synaphobranchus kaupii]|uniref:Uncharacterized protein n=1 Tax=Synaphobranchus kaupii TaxID=118154 RepID=A0A9Q1E9X1_SYNKA|nr:hypothetical protein SKAU_G00405250 [Synaphobranchus kaupii]
MDLFNICPEPRLTIELEGTGWNTDREPLLLHLRTPPKSARYAALWVPVRRSGRLMSSRRLGVRLMSVEGAGVREASPIPFVGLCHPNSRQSQ